jgi:hypothetical protein
VRIVNAVANKLREARALIEERGWAQGEYLNDGDCLCVSGAISMATVGYPDEGDGETDEQDAEFRRIIAALGKAIGCQHSYEIARWNDEPERTQAEVLAAFGKAIALAEAGQ